MGRFVPNPQGIDQMLHEVDLTSNGERVLAAAKANAPVLTGAYRDSLHLEPAPDGLGVIVSGGIRYDIYVEAETGNLARALGGAG